MSTSASTEPVKRGRAVILIQDEDPALARGFSGHLPRILEEEGYGVTLATVLDPAVPDPAIEEIDLLVVLGSESAAHDESLPWLRREWAFLEQVAAADTPILALCFGAQLLCRVLGGEVAEAPDGPELGFITLETDVPELLPPGRWFSSHWDQMSPPAGAAVLAWTEHSVQAWAMGRQVALQFHPEVDGGTLTAWLARRQRVHGTPPDKDLWMDMPAAITDLDAHNESNYAACRDLVRHVIAGDFAEAAASTPPLTPPEELPA